MRLTTAIRDQIVDNAVAKSNLPERAKELIKDRAELAEKMRVYALNSFKGHDAEGIEKLCNQIERLTQQLPEGVRYSSAYSQRTDVHIYIGGQRDTLRFDGYDKRLRDRNLIGMTKGYKITPKATTPIPIPVGHNLARAWERQERELDQYVEDLGDLRNNVRAYVNSVNTSKQLLKLWPEAEELIPVESVAPNRSLPSVRPEDLNKAIGLPSSKGDQS